MEARHRPTGDRRLAGSARWIPLCLLAFLTESAAAAPPWEIWHDLRSLAVLETSSQVLLRSSHCPSGCSSDKHAPGDPRYLRVADGEGVILEESGPGAVTRIWMTTGLSNSAPLPREVRIRFYFDGELEPRLDLPLPDLFNGTTAPFLPPLVADRLSSSGGFVSYVPLPFQRSLRVTLRGADNLRLWFQLTHHRLPATALVPTFTGSEDLAGWKTLLNSQGEDPWPAGSSAEPTSSRWNLAPKATATFFATKSPGVLNQLRLALPPASWRDLRVTLQFDGEVTADLPASELFAADFADPLPTRSALIGVDALDRLYSWFPWPFFSSAVLELTNTGSTPLVVESTVRLHLLGPLPASGRFAAVRTVADPVPSGADLPFLNLERPGRWVGLAARLGAIGTTSRRYLEGDERVFIDGSRHPGHHGTGVEDFFGGGFYFDQGPFRRALHGLSAQGDNGQGEDETSAYRLLLTDAVPFAGRIRAGLEAGPTGIEPMRAWMVGWVYLGKAAI